jgi:predicted RNA binding protein YcfA (HicA-like mRNA interferase family)
MGQKLPILSGHKICKALCNDGFQITKQTGSHIKLKKFLIRLN